MVGAKSNCAPNCKALQIEMWAIQKSWGVLDYYLTTSVKIVLRLELPAVPVTVRTNVPAGVPPVVGVGVGPGAAPVPEAELPLPQPTIAITSAMVRPGHAIRTDLPDHLVCVFVFHNRVANNAKRHHLIPRMRGN